MNSITLIASLLALSALALAAPPAEHHDDCKAKMQASTAKCTAELKLTDDEVAALGKSAPFPAKTKCLIKCIAESFDAFKDGKINEPTVVAMVTKFTKDNPMRLEKHLAVMNECKVLNGTDACDTAAKIYTCVMDGAKKMGMD